MEMYIQLSAENMLSLDLRRVFDFDLTAISCEYMFLTPISACNKKLFTTKIGYHPR
jgi:hypothetical protein